MKQGMVTVVIPIYKTEKYLQRCLNSVVNQTYRNLEILLIDDGSPDDCPALCDAWSAKDDRIRVIHKQNEGLGMARNTGIENANGEYLCFFDSDDYVAVDTIEKAIKVAQKEQSDIVLFSINFVNSNGIVTDSFIPNVGYVSYKGEKVQNEFLAEYLAPNPKTRAKRTFYVSPCLMLYSMKVINDIGWRFVSEREIISEDVYSQLSLFKSVSKVAILPEALYYYCENGQSLSHSYRPDRYKQVKHFYLESKKLCEKLGYDTDIISRISNSYIAFTISAMKQECSVKRPYGETMKALKEIVDDSVLQEVLRAKRKDYATLARKVLYFTILNRLYFICLLLLKLKT